MAKCGTVEEDCLRYGNALGNHLKSSGMSVGEIRKEQVLPRRFELISECQERLRQVSTLSVIEHGILPSIPPHPLQVTCVDRRLASVQPPFSS